MNINHKNLSGLESVNSFEVEILLSNKKTPQFLQLGSFLFL